MLEFDFEGPGRRAALVLGVIPLGLGVSSAVAPVAGQAPDAERVARATPAGVTPPPEFERAVSRGWRSEDGSPGHGYWQNWVGYEMTARLHPETGLLEGTSRMLYAHDAPANLATVWLHLFQNLHKEGAARYEAAEVTGGVTIERLAVDGEDLVERPVSEGPGYEIDGTLMEVRPSIRLEPGDTLQLDVEWEVTLPQSGTGRMGHSDREVYFVAYWFPKMAVFGNLRGWNNDRFLGNAEFFDEFGDYDVEIQVPTGWTVMATGELQNPEDVFSAITLDRLEEAATSDEKVTIADAASRGAGTITTDGVDGWLTYHFTASNVRDFAWTTSNVQRWDATSAVVVDPLPATAVPSTDGGERGEDDEGREDEDDEGDDDDDGDGGEQVPPWERGSGFERPEGGERRVLIHSFWREDVAPLWAEQWLYGKQSIEHHSEYTGFAYPWPHMTSVEGADIIGGGMEFPMLTLIGPYDEEGQSEADLFNVTSHEIAHMWIPMVVGTNENRHAWLDEGSTTFLENESRMALWPGVDHHRVETRTYLQVAARRLEYSMMLPGDYYPPGPGYGIASYNKPGSLMVALRSVMGEDAWEQAYRTFIAEWAYRHPSPWDFFNTFERFAGRDLDWFWTSFYYETWTLDHAVGRIETKTGGGATVTIEDRGLAVFPARVRVRTSGGQDLVHEIPADYWLAGNTTYEIEVAPSAGAVTRVEVDPGGYAPDVDRTNNFWPRG